MIQLCWIDWLSDDTPKFDVQHMVEVCSARFSGSVSIEIRNAVGRIGDDHATEDEMDARMAVVCLKFANEADERLFTLEFPDEIVRNGIGELKA